MSLEPGTRLGPYEIESPIGAGGMGEVYKARDTRLERTVAVKVLPENIAENDEAKQRFEREAKTISSLNHPHICTLYEYDSADETNFLVMEYLEGETLAERISRKGALGLGEALAYAVDIADALDKAHRSGITHRDLKPGNVMLTATGAKLLDFGLARLAPGSTPALNELSALPTQQQPITQEGSILGTFQYMAPEQLEGKEADARTDLFAFGALLYEMLTGDKAFEGKSQASLIASILERDPRPLAELLPLTPKLLDRAVRKCLAKDPEERWQTSKDLRDELRWIVDADEPSAPGKRARRPKATPYLAGGLVGAALAALVAFGSRPSPVDPPIARFTIELPPELRLSRGNPPMVAVSPDGQRLAYIADREIHVRALDERESRALDGTAGAQSLFFSPDGEWLGFWTEGAVRKIAIGGGAPVIICETGLAIAPTWNEDDVIRFGSAAEGVRQCQANGSAAATLFEVAGDDLTFLPQLLPDGEHVLYSAGPEADLGRWELVVQPVDGGPPRTVLEGACCAQWAGTGHLVYYDSVADVVLAVPFDAGRLEVTGGPVPVIEDADRWQFAVSASGTLLYAGDPSNAVSSSLVWVERDGKMTPAVAEPQPFVRPRLARDGRRVAVEIPGPNNTSDVWVYDLERGTRSRVTLNDVDSQDPVWSPDGRHVVFSSYPADGEDNLSRKRVDGTGEEEILLASALPSAHSFSSDGSLLAYYTRESTSNENRDIWILPLDAEAIPFAATRFNERSPSFSPDGHFIAYVSNESGADEIYVQAYTEGGSRWVISTDGGREPVWSHDGRELFYRDGDRMMAVAIETEPAFRAGVPELLFEGRYYAERPESGSQNYDVAPDGRFLMIRASEIGDRLEVVLNWHRELEERAPSSAR